MNNDHIINCPCCDHQMNSHKRDYSAVLDPFTLQPKTFVSTGTINFLISFICLNDECISNQHSKFLNPLTFSLLNEKCISYKCISYCLPFEHNNKILYFEGLEYDDITKIYCHNFDELEYDETKIYYNNSCIGYQAMFSNTTGSSNIAVGYRAGFGTEKILISVPFIPIKIENQNTNAKDIFERLLKLKAFV